MTNVMIDEFGSNDNHFCAAILGYSFKLDDYGTEVLVAPTTRGPTTRSRTAGTVIVDTDVITLLVSNPKTPGKKNHARWEAGYATGRSVKNTLAVTGGPTLGDIRWDIEHGYIRVGAPN